MANISSLNRIFLSGEFIQTVARSVRGWIKQSFQRTISRLIGLSLVGFWCVTLLTAMPQSVWAQTSDRVSGQAMSMAETVQTIADSADVPVEKVDQFAQAYLQVLQLLSDREPELPAAETSNEALEIQASIESEAIALIENAGLTLPEYMQILSLASQDETFQDKVLGRMDESAEE